MDRRVVLDCLEVEDRLDRKERKENTPQSVLLPQELRVIVDSPGCLVWMVILALKVDLVLRVQLVSLVFPVKLVLGDRKVFQV